MSDPQAQPNLAETLARVLPKAEVVYTADEMTTRIAQIALPANMQLKEIDLERLLPNPRRTKGAAELSDEASFLAYVARHRSPSTVVWCAFDPQSFRLAFAAVFDDHTLGMPGWRAHAAVFTPSMSAEWNAWTKSNKQPKSQLEFAEFLEQHEGDIATAPDLPTSLQMMEMATGFEATGEKRVRSVVKLQGGGVQLQYVDGDDDATVSHMKAFDKFAIGIPVFWAGAAYRVDARLRYRHGQGKVSFWYDLIRPDRVHEHAARDVIARVQAGIGDLPMLMGTYKTAA